MMNKLSIILSFAGKFTHHIDKVYLIVLVNSVPKRLNKVLNI